MTCFGETFRQDKRARGCNLEFILFHLATVVSSSSLENDE